MCQALALLDTGAEVNLVRKGLVPSDAFQNSDSPLRILTASGDELDGGDKEVGLEIRFHGLDVDTKTKHMLLTPAKLFEANIEEDVIISYQWMGERDVRIGPRAHGVWFKVKQQTVWVDGVSTNPHQRANARLPRVPVYVDTMAVIAGPRGKPRALDMFCGRKSAGNVLEKWGYEVVTLDNDPKRNPTICTDVLKWDYHSQYPRGYFQLIVACPPCTEYSAAMTKRARQMESADEVVRKTLEIVRYFRPPTWWLETPRNGRLTKRKVIEDLPFVDTDYCRFEDCGYQKPTRFYGSEHLADLKPMLCDRKNCPGLMRDKYTRPGALRAHRWHKGGTTGHVDKEVAYHIPQGVIEYVTGLSSGPPLGRSGCR
jgi:hypothetical protein